MNAHLLSRRVIRAAWLVLLCIAVGAFGQFAYLRLTLKPTPRPEYWAAKINALDPAPAGAMDARKAVQIRTDRPWDSGPAIGSNSFDPYDVLRGPWDETREDVQKVDAVFNSDEFIRARVQLMAATARGWHEPICLSPLNSVVHGIDNRAWGKWLTVHSRWARQCYGDMQATGEDWIATIRLGRQLVRDQIVISWLVYASMEKTAADEMIHTAAEPHPALDSQALMRTILDSLPPLDSATRIVAGEECFIMSQMDHVYVREGGNWLCISEVAPNWTGGAAASSIWNLFSPLYHDLPTVRAKIGRHYAELGRCSDIASCYRAELGGNAALNESALTVLDGGFGPIFGFERAIDVVFRSRCTLEAAITMLALEEYRRELGCYPDRLDDLVPRFMTRLPIDYADRQPLRYRREGGHFVLYSVGCDGRDDGGRSILKYPDAFEAGEVINLDVVFSAVRRPAVLR